MDARAVRTLLYCFVAVVCVAAGASPTMAGGPTAGASATDVSEPFGGQPAVWTAAPAQDDASIEGYDEVRVEVGLHGNNGSATWQVQYRYRLDSDEDKEEWDRLRQDVQDRQDAYLTSFEERWVGEIENARAETNRDMELSGFQVETEEQSGVQAYGFVTFTFQWSSFAHVELNRMEAGDALEGFVLDDRMQLVLTWPEAYNATSIQPRPDDRRDNTAIWNGDETEFVEGEPRIELIERNGDSRQGSDSDRGLPLPWLAALGAALLAVAGVVGWWVAREDDAAGGPPSPDATPEPASDESVGPPPELLSNEERVLRLLENCGGRIKQQEVVSELGWTEAKTSQVVGDLREDDQIDVFRIGRENVLTLPDEDDGDLE